MPGRYIKGKGVSLVQAIHIFMKGAKVYESFVHRVKQYRIP